MVSSMKSRTEIRSLMSDTDVFGVFASSFPPCGVTYALNPLKLGTLNRIRDQRRLARVSPAGMIRRHCRCAAPSYQTFIWRIRNMLGLVRSCCVTYLRTVRMACLLLLKEGMRLRCQAGFQPSTDFSCMKKILIGFLVVLNYGLLSARHRLISVEFSKQFLLPVLVIKGLLLLLFKPAGRAESGLSLICRQEGSAPSAEVVQDFRSEPHFISFRASLKALNTSLMYRF